MSTNAIDSALNFMPEAAKARRTSLFATFTKLAVSVSTGLAAMHRYESLTAKGMSPSQAAAKVHGEFFAD